jgi:orotate phosphoribosyltransferase
MFEHLAETTEFELTSGKESHVYYNFDKMSARDARAAALKLIGMFPIEWTKAEYIAAPAIGGIVPAAFIASWLDLPMVIIEKSGFIRGHEFLGMPNYIIVDDVVSTYREVDRCQKILQAHECIGVAAYIYRGVEDMRENTIVLDRKEPEV